MSEPVIANLAQTSCLNHHYRLDLFDKLGTAPKFKLKLSRTFDETVGPEVLRTISIRMRPAVVLARAILRAHDEYEAAEGARRTARVLASVASRGES